MTALCVHVNVLYASEMSWPLKALPRSSNGWSQELWPSSDNWERAASWKCEDDDRVQHRHCLSPEAAAKARNGEKARRPTPSNRVFEVGFDKKEILELS